MHKVLVAYATRYGSTGEIANEIAATLRSLGIDAEARSVAEVGILDDYAAVVVGSPVYGGKWLSEGLRFISRYRAALARVPTALFAVGLELAPDSERATQEMIDLAADWSRTAPGLAPRAIGRFAGALEPARMGLLMRLLVRLARMDTGDHRDWSLIRAWTHDVAELLEVPRAPRMPRAPQPSARWPSAPHP